METVGAYWPGVCALRVAGKPQSLQDPRADHTKGGTRKAVYMIQKAEKNHFVF